MSVKSTIDDLRKYRSLVLVIFIFCMVSTLSFLAARSMQHSSAASLSGFKPGNIISDAVMGNYNAMTKDEIQAFLTRKNPCNNRNYSQYQSLKQQYPHLDWHFENGHFVCLSEERFGDGVEIGQGQTAAEIIYQAAQDYRINPQVLLVLLEKEQSLISDTYPNTRQYRSATGYGCPDTAACNTKYYGFKNQVRNAAALFRNVLDHGYSAYPEQKKGVYIGYNPNSSCGRSEVYIENRATAALYRYTPYQPNAAALAAGYGAGDGCSAYGNRNFYLYFTDWFGSTQVAVDGEQVVIPDGEYGFASAKTSNRTIGISGNNAQTFEANANTKSQRWQIKRDSSTGYYTITNLANNQVLSAPGSISDGTNVQSSNADNTCNTKWRIYQTPDKYLTFESACSAGYVLDVDNNFNIALWTTHGGLHQKWSIYSGPTINNGIYHIASAINQNQVLDINGGSSTNGATISSWQKHQTLDNQIWQFQYNASGDYYTITNLYTGKRLAIDGNNASNGTTITIWSANDACSQRWKVIKNQSGAYSLHSLCSVPYVLDYNSKTGHDGTKISLWQSHGGQNQQWAIKPVSPALSNGTYLITSRLSDIASFDIINGDNKDGANVALWQSHGGQNQQWQLTYNANDGSYTIYNTLTKRYLGLASQNAADGDNVQLQSNNTTCSTRWYIYPDGNGYNRLASACLQTKVVDLNGGVANGNNITLWQSHGGQHQRWRFTKL